MFNNPVSGSIYRFVELVQGLADSDLEREWTWGSYKSEGVRFAYFRNYEELREMGLRSTRRELHQGRHYRMRSKFLPNIIPLHSG